MPPPARQEGLRQEGSCALREPEQGRPDQLRRQALSQSFVAWHTPGDLIDLDMNLAESNHGGGNRRRRPREPVAIFPGGFVRSISLRIAETAETTSPVPWLQLGQSVCCRLEALDGLAIIVVLFLGDRGFLTVLPFESPSADCRVLSWAVSSRILLHRHSKYFWAFLKSMSRRCSIASKERCRFSLPD